MLTYIMTCETCGTRRPFAVTDQELSIAKSGNPLAKHCATCHTMTNWALDFEERRGGHEPRHGGDRRAVAR